MSWISFLSIKTTSCARSFEEDTITMHMNDFMSNTCPNRGLHHLESSRKGRFIV